MLITHLVLTLAPLCPGLTQEDVAANTPWIVRTQSTAGWWKGDDSVGQAATTALTLFSFIGDGSFPSAGPYRESVARGASWLLRQQDPKSGSFGGELESETDLLSHAWCTLAVSEIGTLDPAWDGSEVRDKATAALLLAQRGDGSFGTARATGWAAYALVAAREGGATVPPAALLRARRALAAVIPTEGDAAHLDAGKVALRCLIGFMVPEPATADGPGSVTDTQASDALSKILQVPDLFPALDPESRMLVAYAAFQCGGETWVHAQREIKRVLLPMQIRQRGENHGGFPTERGFGAARATAFGVLSIEVYFRYARVLGAR